MLAHHLRNNDMFKLAIDFIENCKVSSNKRETVEIKGYFLAFIDAGCLA